MFLFIFLNRHNLKPENNDIDRTDESGYYELFICIADNRRAEYHCTPFGRTDLNRFGADSLRIDNLFETNGFQIILISIGGEPQYDVCVTRQSPMNPVDLAYYIYKYPFVRRCWR